MTNSCLTGCGILVMLFYVYTIGYAGGRDQFIPAQQQSTCIK